VPERWLLADAYEAFIGRWSRRTAAEFLRWLAPAPGQAWLDVGCGSGALAHEVRRLAQPRLVCGFDRSPSFASAARAPGVCAGAADAAALPLARAACDAAVSGLVVNFVPRPLEMVVEMVRVGGQVALYVWDYAGRMELLRHFWDAAVALDPGAAELDEGRRFPLCRPEPLRALLADAGLPDVEVNALDVTTRFRDFDDYWTPFLGAQGPAPGYVDGLDEAARSRLRTALRHRLPVAPDGSIALVARAWAARGRVPG
jgi:SAM-dependent methyltransferase